VNNPAPTAIFHLSDKGPGKAHATREIQLENSSSCRLQIHRHAQHHGCKRDKMCAKAGTKLPCNQSAYAAGIRRG